MIPWLSAHAASIGVGLSIFLALGTAGLWLHRAPARRHAWAECVVVASLACASLLLVPLDRPLRSISIADRAPAAADGAATVSPGSLAATRSLETARAEVSGRRSSAHVVALGFAIGAGLIILRLLAGAVLLARLLRHSEPLPTAGVDGGIRVVVSDRARRPFCAGTRRWGVIVLPTELGSDLTRSELDAVLAHERAHLIAGHGRARLSAALVAPLLFWNPLYWLIVARMRADAELCADDAAARTVGKRQYARALLSLVERTPSLPREPFFPVLGALAPTRTLLDRLERLMSRPKPLDPTLSARSRAVSVALVLVVATFVNAACGTTGPPPTSEPNVKRTQLSFQTLELDGTDLERALNNGERTSAAFPARVAGLDDQPVTLEGYMIPLSFDGDEVSEFLLCRDNLECCVGGAPKWGHWVHALADGASSAPYLGGGRVRVEGDFDVVHPAEWTSPEFTEGIYQLRRWSVQPAEG